MERSEIISYERSEERIPTANCVATAKLDQGDCGAFSRNTTCTFSRIIKKGSDYIKSYCINVMKYESVFNIAKSIKELQADRASNKVILENKDLMASIQDVVDARCAESVARIDAIERTACDSHDLVVDQVNSLEKRIANLESLLAYHSAKSWKEAEDYDAMVKRGKEAWKSLRDSTGSRNLFLSTDDIVKTILDAALGPKKI